MIKKTYLYFKNRTNKLQSWLKKVTLPDYTIFSVFAILTGSIVGLAAVLFHESIHFLNVQFFEQSTDSIFIIGGAAVIFLPAIGMVLQSIMIYFSPKTAKKKGVSEVIKSVAMRGGYIPLRTTIFHFIAPVLCIGTGGTLGPEGPAAQLGGGLSSKLSNFFGMSDSRRRMFTAAGAGAAIAAIFNTPLGGIFFALEIILLNDFQSATFSALILASVTASAISRIFLGNTPAFDIEITHAISYSQFYLFAILGLFAGLLSILFIRYSGLIRSSFNLKSIKRIPRPVLMLIVGLLVGLSGYFYKEIFGIGYIAINKILAQELPIKIVVILLALKFILVPLVLQSGGFGGVFAPSLFMGACFGYIFAVVMNNVWGLELDTTTYVLVSMGAVLGGINSIPISAILIIFEMTKDYSFILPLMLAVVISTTLVQIIIKGSVHVKHLEEQGFRIISGKERNILTSIFVKEILKPEIELVKQSTPLVSLISKLLNSSHSTLYVTSESGKIVGFISENELRPIITEYEQVRDVLVANDIARSDFNIVSENDDLDKILKMFGKSSVDEFPVLGVEDSKIIGTVSRQDVISMYNKESLKNNLADGLAHELSTLKIEKTSRITQGYSIIERKAPESFIGKTLKELRIRNKYGLDVLMIKNRSSLLEGIDDEKIIMPDSEHIIKKEDVLILFGADENISSLS